MRSYSGWHSVKMRREINPSQKAKKESCQHSDLNRDRPQSCQTVGSAGLSSTRSYGESPGDQSKRGRATVAPCWEKGK